MRLFFAAMFVIAHIGSVYAADKVSDVEKRHQAIEAARIESLVQHQAREKELAAQPLPCITPEECAKVSPPPAPPVAVTEEQQEQQLETKQVQDEKAERRKGVSTTPFKTAH